MCLSYFLTASRTTNVVPPPRSPLAAYHHFNVGLLSAPDLLQLATKSFIAAFKQREREGIALTPAQASCNYQPTVFHQVLSSTG